jgi:hypothetical protein
MVDILASKNYVWRLCKSIDTSVKSIGNKMTSDVYNTLNATTTNVHMATPGSDTMLSHKPTVARN